MPVELPQDVDSFHALLRQRIRDQDAIDERHKNAAHDTRVDAKQKNAQVVHAFHFVDWQADGSTHSSASGVAHSQVARGPCSHRATSLARQDVSVWAASCTGSKTGGSET